MRLRASRREAVLLAIFVLLGFGYSVLVPMWEAPDETNHYLVALHLARRGALPPSGYNAESHQPPAFYWLAGGVLGVLDRIDPDFTSNYRPPPPYRFSEPPRFDWNRDNYRFLWGPQILRWLDIAIGAAALHLIYLGALRLTPGSETLALGAAALTGLNPQFVHICASISNDPLSYCAGALLFNVSTRLATREASPMLLAGAALLAVALPLLVKLSLLPVSALVAIAVSWRALRHFRGRERTGALALAAVGAAAVALLYMLRGQLDSELSAQLWRRATHVRADAFDNLPAVTRRFLVSYWGLAGWMATPLPPLFVRGLCGLAGIGLVAAFGRQMLGVAAIGGRKERAALAVAASTGIVMIAVLFGPWPAALAAPLGFLLLPLVLPRSSRTLPANEPAWQLMWGGLALALLVFLKNYLSESFGVQGRFLFPAAGFMAVLAISGWLALLPRRWHAAVPTAAAALLVAANLALWIDGIAPTYYQPFLD